MSVFGILLVVGGLALVVGVALLARYLRRPHAIRVHRGVEIRYADSDADWIGLDEAIDVVLDKTMGLPWAHLPRWAVEVVSATGRVRSPLLPFEKELTATGTVRIETWAGLGIGRRTYVAVIRRRRGPDGVELPAAHSALIHEVAQHVLPHFIAGNWNPAHMIGWASELEAAIEVRVRTVSAGRADPVGQTRPGR